MRYRRAVLQGTILSCSDLTVEDLTDLEPSVLVEDLEEGPEESPLIMDPNRVMGVKVITTTSTYLVIAECIARTGSLLIVVEEGPILTS